MRRSPDHLRLMILRNITAVLLHHQSMCLMFVFHVRLVSFSALVLLSRCTWISDPRSGLKLYSLHINASVFGCRGAGSSRETDGVLPDQERQMSPAPEAQGEGGGQRQTDRARSEVIGAWKSRVPCHFDGPKVGERKRCYWGFTATRRVINFIESNKSKSVKVKSKPCKCHSQAASRATTAWSRSLTSSATPPRRPKVGERGTRPTRRSHGSPWSWRPRWSRETPRVSRTSITWRF